MNRNRINIIYPDEAIFSFIMENELSVEDNLERVFAEWNAGSGMECELFIKTRIRSLSVNDIVMVNGKYFQCLSFGWKEVTAEYVEQLETNVSVHPRRYIDGAWFALNDVMRKHNNGVLMTV